MNKEKDPEKKGEDSEKLLIFGENIKEKPTVLDFEKAIKKGSNPISINISFDDYSNILQLVNSCDGEVGWLSCVKRDGNEFNLVGTFVPPQTVTSASVDIDSSKFHLVMDQISEKYGEEEAFFEIMPNLRGFCHSHADMSVYWSETDENGILGLANGDWLVSIVVNKKEEVRGRIDLFSPIHIAIDNVPVTIEYREDDPKLSEIIEKNVKKPEKALALYHTSGGGSGYGFADTDSTHPGRYVPGTSGNFGRYVSGDDALKLDWGKRKEIAPFSSSMEQAPRGTGVFIEKAGSGASEFPLAYTKIDQISKNLMMVYGHDAEIMGVLREVDGIKSHDKKMVAQIILAGMYCDGTLEQRKDIKSFSVLLDEMSRAMSSDEVDDFTKNLTLYYVRDFFEEKYSGSSRRVQGNSYWMFTSDIKKLFAGFSLYKSVVAFTAEHSRIFASKEDISNSDSEAKKDKGEKKKKIKKKNGRKTKT